MKEIQVYRVKVEGTVDVEATTVDEAKQRALDYFSVAPLDLMSILEIKTALVNEP